MTSSTSEPRRRAVFLIDGDCGFCTTTGRWLRRRVARGRFDVRPWQEVDLGAFGLTPAAVAEAAWFVPVTGTPRRGHAAFAAACRAGARPWRPVGTLLLAPGISQLAAAAYAWIARHRHAFPGGTPACAVDPPAGSARP